MVSLLYLRYAFNASDEGGWNVAQKRPPGSYFSDFASETSIVS